MDRMLVTLSLVAGPGFPLGCVDHRYEIELALPGTVSLLIRPACPQHHADSSSIRIQAVCPSRQTAFLLFETLHRPSRRAR